MRLKVNSVSSIRRAENWRQKIRFEFSPPSSHTTHTFHITLTHGLQYHQKRICARDDCINSTALSLSIDGYTEGPYSTAAAQSFVSTVTKQRKEKEESAKTEKVSFLVCKMVSETCTYVLAYRVFCGQCVHVHIYLYLSAINVVCGDLFLSL